MDLSKLKNVKYPALEAFSAKFSGKKTEKANSTDHSLFKQDAKCSVDKEDVDVKKIDVSMSELDKECNCCCCCCKGGKKGRHDSDVKPETKHAIQPEPKAEQKSAPKVEPKKATKTESQTPKKPKTYDNLNDFEDDVKEANNKFKESPTVKNQNKVVDKMNALAGKVLEIGSDKDKEKTAGRLERLINGNEKTADAKLIDRTKELLDLLRGKKTETGKKPAEVKSEPKPEPKKEEKVVSEKLPDIDAKTKEETKPSDDKNWEKFTPDEIPDAKDEVKAQKDAGEKVVPEELPDAKDEVKADDRVWEKVTLDGIPETKDEVKTEKKADEVVPEPVKEEKKEEPAIKEQPKAETPKPAPKRKPVNSADIKTNNGYNLDLSYTENINNSATQNLDVKQSDKNNVLANGGYASIENSRSEYVLKDEAAFSEKFDLKNSDKDTAFTNMNIAGNSELKANVTNDNSISQKTYTVDATYVNENKDFKFTSGFQAKTTGETANFDATESYGMSLDAVKTFDVKGGEVGIDAGVTGNVVEYSDGKDKKTTSSVTFNAGAAFAKNLVDDNDLKVQWGNRLSGQGATGITNSELGQFNGKVSFDTGLNVNAKPNDKITFNAGMNAGITGDINPQNGIANTPAFKTQGLFDVNFKPVDDVSINASAKAFVAGNGTYQHVGANAGLEVEKNFTDDKSLSIGAEYSFDKANAQVDGGEKTLKDEQTVSAKVEYKTKKASVYANGEMNVNDPKDVDVSVGAKFKLGKK